MSTKVLLTMQPSTASSNSAIFRGKLLSTVSHSFPFSIPLKDSTFGKRVSGECERGTQECVRHNDFNILLGLTTSACATRALITGGRFLANGRLRRVLARPAMQLVGLHAKDHH